MEEPKRKQFVLSGMMNDEREWADKKAIATGQPVSVVIRQLIRAEMKREGK